MRTTISHPTTNAAILHRHASAQAPHRPAHHRRAPLPRHASDRQLTAIDAVAVLTCLAVAVVALALRF